MYPIGAKLGVSEFFYTHVGDYYGNGLVFHNHWKTGPKIISLQEFSNGRKVTVLSAGVDDVPAFYHRAQSILANPKPYSFVNNNCEHTASYAREGVASSPQLALCGMICLFAIGGYTLSRVIRA